MQKPLPAYSLDLVMHPSHDTSYVHFEHSAEHPFQANPVNLPRVNAWWLCEAALLSYWTPDIALPVFTRAGLQGEYVTNDSTDCYIAWQRDAVMVVFRGTQPDDWTDILADANILLVPWQTGAVHLGFKRALEAIRTKLDAVLAPLTSSRTLWFCGHSLGAALATLAADQYSATRGVCTFGSPRVGDAAFAHAFDAKFAGRSLRFVNEHDIVTHVPPPIGYRHVDPGRYIGSNGVLSDHPPALDHFFADLFGRPQQMLGMIQGFGRAAQQTQTAPNFLLDHMPKAYAVFTWNDYDANG